MQILKYLITFALCLILKNVMLMELSLKERLILLPLIPEKGNMLEVIASKALVEKISLTAEEIQDLEIKNENEQIFWSAEKERAYVFSIELTDLQKTILKKIATDLDEKGEVNLQNLDLLQKLMEL